MSYLVIAATIFHVAATPDWMDCPTPCRCKWASGKKTAVCSSSGLTGLPTLSSDLQVLELQNNFITYLPKDAFSSVDLLNMQKLFMKNATLKELHRDAFRDLKILIEVDLSHNQLSTIPRGTFTGNDRLKILCLSGNPLKILSSEQFPILPHLRILDLEDCLLNTIHRDAFIHLNQLENLNLKSNLLINSSKYIYLPMRKLKALDLVGNPWRCDCKLRSFRDWYLASNLHSVSLACNEPSNYAGKFWEDIPSLEFACPPEVEIDNSVIHGDTGDNVTFGCYVRGDPEPEVTWLFNGHPLSWNGTRLDQGFSMEIERNLSEKSVNLRLYNITNSDAGDYVCRARSLVGTLHRNATLILRDSLSMSSLHDANYLFIFIGVLAGVLLIVVMVVSAIACTCLSLTKKRRRKRHRRKSKVKGSKSFYDQEKHLLDMSTSNTEQQSRKSSFEMLSSHASMELLKNSVSMSSDRFEPVHFYNSRHGNETTAVIPLSSAFSSGLGVYPPPPEFSNNTISQSGTLGNIFISVSLTQDPNITVDRYPDLLDAHCKADKNTLEHSSSFCGLSVAPYATLPRKPLRSIEPSRSDAYYDNMGKRVTIGGNSTLSLPEECDGIPTPPPPPLSSKPDNDYIPL